MKTEHQKMLLQIAQDAIFQALEATALPFSGSRRKGETFFQALEKNHQKVPNLGSFVGRVLPPGEFPVELKEERATFVTLTIDGHLRGCIGMLEACRPLAEDVAENAVSAAFHDPRFPPLSQEEFDDLKISISVLSPPQEMNFSSEADLVSQIRPGVDGLILQEGFRRGTFLPSVWEELSEGEMFFKHLKLKAGLSAGYWSDTLRVFRYTTEYIQETEGAGNGK